MLKSLTENSKNNSSYKNYLKDFKKVSQRTYLV